MANKKVTLTAAAGLAVAGLFQSAATQAQPTQSQTTPPRAKTAQQTTTEVVGRFVELVKGLKGSSDITADNLGRALGIKLDRGDRNYGYTGPTLDDGWSFSILLLAPDGPTKAVVLMFENKDMSASSAPACLMDLESTRTAWRAAGYRESEDRGEIGQFLALLYYKGDVEVSIDARRILVDGERKCVGMVTITG
jgi:type IV secretion system protein VirD4